MRKLKKYNFLKVFDLQNSSRTNFYKNILFPKADKMVWSSSVTTLPSDKNKEEFEYIMQYSPYDNIAELNYPSMLVTGGLWDSQVQYYEPAKYVAKLRDFNKSQNPILMKMNMSAGHSGVSGRFESLKEVAMEYAFLLRVDSDK